MSAQANTAHGVAQYSFFLNHLVFIQSNEGLGKGKIFENMKKKNVCFTSGTYRHTLILLVQMTQYLPITQTNCFRVVSRNSWVELCFFFSLNQYLESLN